MFLIAMDSTTAATVCIAVPQWFWFGFLIVLSFTSLSLSAPSYSRFYSTTVYTEL